MNIGQGKRVKVAVQETSAAIVTFPSAQRASPLHPLNFEPKASGGGKFLRPHPAGLLHSCQMIAAIPTEWGVDKLPRLR